MNEDLARAIDDLLSWLDTRYQPDIKRTLTPRQYHSAWEIDKIQFRQKAMEVLEHHMLDAAEVRENNGPSND